MRDEQLVQLYELHKAASSESDEEIPNELNEKNNKDGSGSQVKFKQLFIYLKLYSTTLANICFIYKFNFSIHFCIEKYVGALIILDYQSTYIK